MVDVDTGGGADLSCPVWPSQLGTMRIDAPRRRHMVRQTNARVELRRLVPGIEHATAVSMDTKPPESESNSPSREISDAEPLSWPLLARFFGVPLVIIGTIVGGAVLVVFLFGGPSSPQQHSVDDLLTALESSGGAKTIGLLLPREKEHWQTGLELAQRLEKKEREFTDADLEMIAIRVGAMIHTELGEAGTDPTAATTARRTDCLSEPPDRLMFLIRALGLTERPEAVEPLVEVIRRGRESHVAAAIAQLGDLNALPGARDAIDPMLLVLDRSPCPTTRLLACTALSVVADPSDLNVIESLATVRLAAEGEVAWSAALALARLESAKGKSTLLDLLDRSFWETGERYETMDASGNIRRYAMPASRIADLLIASIDAVAHLDDADLWKMIERLKSDSSPLVRERAGQAIDGRT